MLWYDTSVLDMVILVNTASGANIAIILQRM